MQEVGGSIPPGSTTLRPSGYAWRSHVMPEGRSVVPGEAHLGEDGPRQAPFSVIASEAKQSIVPQNKNGLLRRVAPRNDSMIAVAFANKRL
jgi:hypothetical protein